MKCTNCSNVLKPVVAIDIDGTLGKYHYHFHEFAEKYFGAELPNDYSGKGEFSDHLGLNKAEYRDAKLAYRQGGFKRWMPAFPGTQEMCQWLRDDEGVELWIATTRPFLRLDNIDPDTREWLRRNAIGFDGMIYGEDKYQQLTKIVGKERIVAVIDDLADCIEEANDIGLPTIRHDTMWNKDEVNLASWSAHHLRSVMVHVNLRVAAWRKDHGLETLA